MNIGELSRLTGLPVKTIRYYSDVGLVPEADRSHANYRQYDHTSLVRLEFVRTLRELGLDLATIRRVLDRGEDLASVAAAHAEAIGVQIRVLRLRRAALRVVARHNPTPKEIDRMNRIAQASADERHRILQEFFDSIFDRTLNTPEATEFANHLRSVSADLPDDPTDEQVDAWIELAELVRQADFRDRLRRMGQRSFGPDAKPLSPTAMPEIHAFTERVAEAMDEGVRPDSSAAADLVSDVVGRWAAAGGRQPDEAYQRELLDQLELSVEPRAERYWQLMATINGWPPIPTTIHRWAWFLDALRAPLPEGGDPC